MTQCEKVVIGLCRDRTIFRSSAKKR